MALLPSAGKIKIKGLFNEKEPVSGMDRHGGAADVSFHEKGRTGICDWWFGYEEPFFGAKEGIN